MNQPATAPPSTPADDAPPRAARWRRWTAGTLVVISCILAPLSVITIWVRNQVLSTDRYVANVTPLANDPEVIDAVANGVTNALFSRLDVAEVARDALPDRAEFLADPLATALRDFTYRQTVDLLSTEEFRNIWVRANEVAHEQLEKALTGSGTVIETDDGKVVLNLSGLFEIVRGRLQERGIGVFDRIPINELSLRFEIVDASGLASAQRAARLLNTLSWAVPILAFVCLGGALALSSDRRRTLMRWGIGVAVAVAVIGVGIAVGRKLYLDAATSDTLPRDTAAIVFDTLVRFLRYGVRVVIAFGLVVAFAAWVTGPSRAATSFRGMFSQAGTAAGERGMNFGGFGTWVGAHRKALRIALCLLALVALLLWNHPTIVTLLVIALILGVVLAFVEIVARASTTDPKEASLTPEVSGSATQA
jgi:hypothetical protein